MTETKDIVKTHPTESELADFLSGAMPQIKRKAVADHAGSCKECLDRIVSAYDAVKTFKQAPHDKKGKINFMKRINIYLVLAVISFCLSFVVGRYFVQFLVATLLLGIKWIIDAKSTKMLITIYEAWKKETQVHRLGSFSKKG